MDECEIRESERLEVRVVTLSAMEAGSDRDNVGVDWADVRTETELPEEAQEYKTVLDDLDIDDKIIIYRKQGGMS